MNRKGEEAKRFTTEFAESTEKEFGAEFTMEEVDSRESKIEREEKISGGGTRERGNAPSRLRASVTVKAEEARFPFREAH
jgi:hypothetical protein